VEDAVVKKLDSGVYFYVVLSANHQCSIGDKIRHPDSGQYGRICKILEPIGTDPVAQCIETVN
jgi:hypothetical protein